MNFQLEKYTGPASKHICPSCGRRSFKRYIRTESGEKVDDSCGRCDHEQSCGYHLTPKDFFAAHPSAKDIYDNSRSKTPALHTLDFSLVTQSFSQKSTFCLFLRKLLGDERRFQSVCQRYHLGATRDGAVIFWQIDQHQRVRTGKVMHYTPDGHRTGNPNWIHAILRSRNQLQPDWQLTQCLFGEHLLTSSQCDHVATPVCLVESEKSAVICAAFYPQYIWLATGGCKGLSAEKLYPLAGRRVIIYPDAGCLTDWQHKLQTMARNIDYSLVEDLEQYPPNTDIADLIVAEICGTPLPTIQSNQAPTASLAEPANAIMLLNAMHAANPAILELEQKLDLKLESYETEYPK